MSIALGTPAGNRRSAQKFQNPDWTADGQARAHVALTSLKTLWLNTGTLCNIECVNCYIDSGPTKDQLAYLSAKEAGAYLKEIKTLGLPTEEIGITGGEPFLNPDILEIIESCLADGHATLVLTNAMRPMMRPHVQKGLLALLQTYGTRLCLRISFDHYTAALHDAERGAGSFSIALQGVRWLVENGFHIAIAGRTFDKETEEEMRRGFASVFEAERIPLDAQNPAQLMLFPEMDEAVDVPEITTACWGILGKSPDDIMCATSRMVVKHKGADAPSVVACTLLPYDKQFELGTTLDEALKRDEGRIKLNHPHCAKFCVLGGGACSA